MEAAGNTVIVLGVLLLLGGDSVLDKAINDSWLRSSSGRDWCKLIFMLSDWLVTMLSLISDVLIRSADGPTPLKKNR